MCGRVCVCVCVCMCVLCVIGVAGPGRLQSVCEGLEETGGWCAEQLSSIPAGCSPQHTASRGQKHADVFSHTHASEIQMFFTFPSVMFIFKPNNAFQQVQYETLADTNSWSI